MLRSNRRRWVAAVLLGFSGAAIITVSQSGAGLRELAPGSRKDSAAQSGGARPGSIVETTVLAMGKSGADWGSDDLRDAVAGAPAPGEEKCKLRRWKAPPGAAGDSPEDCACGPWGGSSLKAADPARSK